MDKSTQERLVGAVILVALVVLIVPALLTGPREPPAPGDTTSSATRSVEIELVPAAPAPEAALDSAVAAPPEEPLAERGEDDRAAPPEEAMAAPVERGQTSSDATPVMPPIRPPEAPARPAVPAAGVWAAQVAALSRKDSAERLVGELRDRGYPAFVVEYRDAARVLYRVRVGPEQERARAEQLAARLSAEGHRAAVVAHP